MIVYSNRKRRVSTGLWGHSWRDALIRFGEVEAAVADNLCAEHDAPHPLLERLRAIAVQLGSGDLDALKSLPPLPAELQVSVPEGYAFYAVYPEDYAKAALRFYREIQPRSAVVIGIRSIGTSLSAVVAAALRGAGCQVQSFTVRPRGHPFDRHLVVNGFQWNPEAYFLVVDEGPGLSGSSFACVASHLSGSGVPDSRIIFFPSRDTDGRHFVSASARSQWPRYRKYTEIRAAFPGFIDLSGGRWRQFSPAAPPVQPEHERRKYLRDGRLFKFEGLGEYGEAKFARAQMLSDAGYAPRPYLLEDGYLVSQWIQGRPVTIHDQALAHWIVRYLQFLESHCRADRPVPFDENLEMIRVNVTEGLGPSWLARVDLLERFRSELCDRPTTQIDGQMLPHEFLAADGSYVKTDTLDHHDDHFFPGCQDIAWDVAGASLELGLSQINSLVPKTCLSFYKIAYLSYRLGYCELGAGSGSDIVKFRAMARRYREQLRYELDCLR